MIFKILKNKKYWYKEDLVIYYYNSKIENMKGETYEAFLFFIYLKIYKEIYLLLIQLKFTKTNNFLNNTWNRQNMCVYFF